MIFFAFKGLWHDFRYCVFDFNFLARSASENSLAYRIHLTPTIIIALPIILYVARRMICAYRWCGFGVPARLYPNGLYFLFSRLQDFLAGEKS